MIIVEGPDGSGKTNLVQRIEEKFDLTREPRVVSGEAIALTNLSAWTSAQLTRGFGWRLYDRFALISSPNYCMLPNPTFDGMFRNRAWLMHKWEQMLTISPVIIFCLPPLETVINNVMEDRENKVVWPHIETIYWLYHNMVAMLGAVVVWDYTKDDLTKVYDWVYKAKERGNGR